MMAKPTGDPYVVPHASCSWGHIDDLVAEYQDTDALCCHCAARIKVMVAIAPSGVRFDPVIVCLGCGCHWDGDWALLERSSRCVIEPPEVLWERARGEFDAWRRELRPV